MSTRAPSSRVALLLAAVVSAAIGAWQPWGWYLMYPITLLGTCVHELGHGLTAIVVGGHFYKLAIYADGSGLAFNHTTDRGFPVAIVAAGGLLAPPIVGALILCIARGPVRARAVLAVMSVGLLVVLMLWVRTPAGLLSMPLVAAGIGVFALWGGPRECMFAAQFLGLRLGVDTLSGGLRYIFTDEVVLDGVHYPSDIVSVARNFAAPQLLCSLVIGGLSVLLAVFGLWAAWRAPSRSKI